MYNTQPLSRTPRPTIAARITAYLAAHGPTHLRALAPAVRAHESSVAAVCGGLVRQGHVRRTARGTYALTQEER
jgi:DNA-binding IclR family transcriptional regulator